MAPALGPYDACRGNQHELQQLWLCDPANAWKLPPKGPGTVCLRKIKR